MKFLILFLLVTFSTTVSAQFDALPVSLTARIVGQTGIEQVSLVFRDNKAILIVNSNFLTPGQWPVMLGVFEKVLDDKLKLMETILTADYGNRETLQSEKGLDKDPHRLQILLGENEVPADASSYTRLMDTLLRVLSEVETWKATTGAKVARGPGRTLLYDILNQVPTATKTQSCPLKGPCKIPELGLIWPGKTI